jgi:tetratricopeptide (TPR) repeat protein
MLETLRAYGTQLLAGAGEQEQAAAMLAGYALRVAEEAAAGLAGTAEAAAVRWLDAEDAATQQVLGWAVDHDPAMAARLAVALAPWWHNRGRLAGQYLVLQEIGERATGKGDAWSAARFWLGFAAYFSLDLAGALEVFTTIVDACIDQPPSRALAEGLAGRSLALANMGQLEEASTDGRQSLAVAREIGYPAGQALALQHLTVAAVIRDDMDAAVQLAWQIQQIHGDIPGWVARMCSFIFTVTLAETGDLTAARRVCAAALDKCEAVGDLLNQVRLLIQMAVMDLQAGRPEDATIPMREALQIAVRTGGGFDLDFGLDWCGHLCAATGRYAEALTVWAALAATLRQVGSVDVALDARYRREPQRTARDAQPRNAGRR